MDRQGARHFQVVAGRLRWRHPTRFQLFLIAMAAVSVVGIVGPALLIAPFFERYILGLERDQMTEELWAESRHHLTAVDFVSGTARAHAFEELLGMLPGVSGVTAFDPTGRVVWSNDERQIGRTVTDDALLARALTGDAVIHLERTKEHMVKTYVPITLPGSPRLTGVIGIRKSFTAVVIGIRRTQHVIVGVTGIIGLLLYLSLVLLAWRASMAERSSIKLLEATNQALTAAQARLVEKERLAAAGEVVIGLHHSVLNPLAGILGALQVLKQDKITPDERHEALGQAEAEIHEIERVMRSLSALRRVTATAYVGKSTMLDLEGSCREEESG